jgi:signal transduction histidine kinase
MLPNTLSPAVGGQSEQSEHTGHQPSFASLVPGVRCGILVLSAFVAAVHGSVTTSVVAWGAVLVVHAAWRARRPRTPSATPTIGTSAAGTPTIGRSTAGTSAAGTPAVSGSAHATSAVPGSALAPGGGPVEREILPLAIVIEVFIAVLAVDSTGYWGSPFAFCLLAVVVAAGIDRGFRLAMQVAGVVTVSVAVPAHLHVADFSAAALGISGQWALELVLVAILAGYARRLFGEAEERHSQALDRVSQLAEANDLLVSLHRVAQSLPASLNLDQVVTSTVERVRSLVDCDVTVLLLRDDVTGRWIVASAEGAVVGRTLADENLPVPLRAATASSVASLVVSLAPGEGFGPTLVARSGLYAPLRARGGLVGLIALEHHEAGRYGRRDLQLLDGFIDSAALAIDNARWFGRLRGVGADEERTRIARDMHDRIGQSLAYVAFELDRITKTAEEPFRTQLDGLRSEVRSVLGEVRETLSDLRAEVSDQRGLAETLEAHLQRVATRSDVEVDFRSESTARLPIVQERELWRIAQEAITNVERHARAGHLRVRWTCDGRSAHLTVADDGRGFAVAARRRSDAFGITGMQERADAVGARLEIESEPYVGTLVECHLDAPALVAVPPLPATPSSPAGRSLPPPAAAPARQAASR